MHIQDSLAKERGQVGKLSDVQASNNNNNEKSTVILTWDAEDFPYSALEDHHGGGVFQHS